LSPRQPFLLASLFAFGAEFPSEGQLIVEVWGVELVVAYPSATSHKHRKNWTSVPRKLVPMGQRLKDTAISLSWKKGLKIFHFDAFNRIVRPLDEERLPCPTPLVEKGGVLT
jgi:hypothetical protein